MAKAKAKAAKSSEVAGDNGSIWNSWSKTPPEYVKDFTRGGGFRGTSIDPIYRVMKLTEKFGPVGQGWQFIQEDQWSDGGSGAYCVYVRGHLRYRFQEEDGSWSEWYCTMSHTGGTVADRSPDESYKMAETDALGKCCVDLGMCVDIYLGIHEGDKYQRDESGSAGRYQPDRARQPQGRGKSSNATQARQAAVAIEAGEVEAVMQSVTSCEDDAAVYALSRKLYNRLLASKDLSDNDKAKVAEGFLSRRAGLVTSEMLDNYKQMLGACETQGWITKSLNERLFKLAQSNTGTTPGA